jgi:predicted O-methyltransferase YrrM
MFSITEEQLQAVKSVPHFRDSMYADLDIRRTLDYMARRFVQPLAQRLDVRNATIADCAAGYGWLSFAYLLSGGGRAILVDPDEPRLNAAKQIAEVLGLADRCELIRAYMQDLNLVTDSVDIFSTIETLEHVGKENVPRCIQIIANSAKSAVVLTTPNWLFPVVAHDTQLPLAHWMPSALRRPYARFLHREKYDVGNHFLRPWNLRPLWRKFKPDTSVQTFRSVAEFDRFYPHYMPYGDKDRARDRVRPKQGLRLFHSATAAVMGRLAFAVSPNIASVWVRR